MLGDLGASLSQCNLRGNPADFGCPAGLECAKTTVLVVNNPLNVPNLARNRYKTLDSYGNLACDDWVPHSRRVDVQCRFGTEAKAGCFFELEKTHPQKPRSQESDVHEAELGAGAEQRRVWDDLSSEISQE